ncbi:hypothetical protein [Streptomyces sp. NPDC059593]|uniref:hypothetical protein n=1 Tax=Streptomyces sp. NPDC059593 TaxID=3346878 RepID=UPI0036A6B669
MTWSPASLVARDSAVQRLIDAHPQEYHRLFAAAEGELPGQPCDSCAYLGADALELADLLGHDRQGHQVHRALWAGQILGVPELLRVLDGDVGLALPARPGAEAGRPGTDP